MPRAAVVGSPVAHSLSPVIHRAAYAALGLSAWSYDAIECDANRLCDLLAGGDFAGLSVTMPLKRVALDAADVVCDRARAVGAANTLVRRDDGWHADNTDIDGVLGALRDGGVVDATGAVILGAGGTARAALAALRELGEPEPTVLVREPGRAGELRAAAERLGMRPRVLRGMDRTELFRAPVVICALPAGAADRLADAAWWTGNGTLLDVVYTPWPTPLAESTARAGRHVVGGREVLLHQAIGQVRKMTGRSAPIDAMRAALPQA
ncbi:MAG: shikimate dehydrogenase [Mycobacteriales bacterium]